MPRYLGQHFLKNPAAAKKIIAALGLKKNDVVVEIGPGHGELTVPLAKACEEAGARIVAIEKDKPLTEGLRGKNMKNVEVVQGDALELLPTVATTHYKLAGNIPYYITGHLLRLVGELEKKPERAIFMVQKEVAERISAAPPKMNRLAASVQFWADAKILFHILRSDFSPPPEVDSAVILLQTKHPGPKSPEAYYAAVRAAFAQPRKTILNNLAAAHGKEKALASLAAAGVDPKSRPQNLTIAQIEEISTNF